MNILSNKIDSKENSYTSNPSDQVPCFASYLNTFNLAQLTALIMGIDIGDIALNQSSAYLREHNDYPYGFYEQYLSNLESIKTMALANQQNLFNVAMFEESGFPGNKKEKISLTETTISKINLIALCEEMGLSFDEMLRKQKPIALPIHQQAATEDLLPNQPDNHLQAENEQLKRHIAELEQQVGQAQSSPSKTNNIDLNIKNEQVINNLKDNLAKLTTENNTLKEQLSKQVALPADDKELASNSQASVARMLSGILTEHGYDLSPAKGKGVANDMIVSAAKNNGTSVTRNFVAGWLVRAREAKINKINRVI